MKSNPNLYQIYRNEANNDNRSYHFKYLDQAQALPNSHIRRYAMPLNLNEKQNNIRDTNLRQSPNQYTNFQKSTTSTNQQTHPKASTQNLHNLRLQSLILQLQKTLAQQNFQLQTFTEQSTHYMKLCEQQKQTLLSMNIQAMQAEYQGQISQLLQQRNRVEEIIAQLQDDYNEVYTREDRQLEELRNRNGEISRLIQEELARKRVILGLIADKERQLYELQVGVREGEERIDQLRNIQRKLNIAIRQLQMLREKNGIKNNKVIKQIKQEPQTRQKMSSTDQKVTVDRYRQSPRSPSNLHKNLSKQKQRERNSSTKKYKYQYQFYREGNIQ